MVKCAMKFCPNSALSLKKKDGITFHIFPVEHARKLEWIKAVNRNDWLPSKSSVVCSIHFTKDSFYTTEKGFQKLFKSAVPISYTSMPLFRKISRSDLTQHDMSPEAKLRSEATKWKKLFKERTTKVKTLQRSIRVSEIKMAELKNRKMNNMSDSKWRSKLILCGIL